MRISDWSSDVCSSDLTLSLGGCATIQRIQAITELGTASVANPITRERLAQIESAATLVFVGLNTWKRTCRANLIPQECRQHIRTVRSEERSVGKGCVSKCCSRW